MKSTGYELKGVCCRPWMFVPRHTHQRPVVSARATRAKASHHERLFFSTLASWDGAKLALQDSPHLGLDLADWVIRSTVIDEESQELVRRVMTADRCCDDRLSRKSVGSEGKPNPLVNRVGRADSGNSLARFDSSSVANSWHAASGMDRIRDGRPDAVAQSIFARSVFARSS